MFKFLFENENTPVGLSSFNFNKSNSNSINLSKDWSLLQEYPPEVLGKKYTIDQIHDYHQ